MSTLTVFLENQIKNTLLGFEPAREAVKDAAIDLANLDEAPYTALNGALARMASTHIAIKTALAAGNLFAWVSPRLAAVAFEGVFETCLGVWLAAGAPSNPTVLRPGVDRFVDWQVRMFAAAIGDH
jgi:hypothetical protein